MKFVCLFVAVVLAIGIQNVSAQDLDNECLIPCPLILMPVCGEDAAGNQRTFANECLIRADNCRDKTAFVKKSEGECDE